jgi:hypothetical protein
MNCPECGAEHDAKVERRIASNSRLSNLHRRDMFAAAAMTGLLAKEDRDTWPDLTFNVFETLADTAFAIADAMLKAREEQ